MGFRFEFDPANKILLLRCEGRLTDESLAGYYRAARKYSTATDASVGIAPTTVGFGLARMFQTLGEPTRPLLKVVHTLDEALAALGIQSAQFELLE